jgi:peptidoglycan/xylan/chitin deacetylase (PgdA/CDA1 family)
MRIVVIVIASLLTLGLAAFGIEAAQKTSGQASLIARIAHSVSPTQAPENTAAAEPQRNLAPPSAPHPVAAPVVQVSDVATLPVSTGSNAPIMLAQNAVAAPASSAAPATATPSGNASGAKSLPACANPNGLGLARVVEIDTTGGPGFGFEHFKQYDFLRDKEVVLTFDDGPWPENTAMVLKALTDNCSKATFFEIGEHAIWHPEIARQVAAAGMTIGTHTWSHKDLARNPYASDLDQAKQEIEMGISAVRMAVEAPVSSFFRFPDLQHPPQMMSYLAERNIATFSTDIDSFDFKMHRPADVIKSVMTKLDKRGKGIILMHDFQHGTAEAMPELLRQLKAGGYKVVHMVSKQPVTSLPKYDDMVKSQDKLSVTNTRPESSVVKTISE